MKIFGVFCVLFLISAKINCDDKSLGSLIDEVYTKLKANNWDEQSQDFYENEKASDDCMCVSYFLCSLNKTIITDGVGVIDIRVQKDECPNYLDICCQKPLDEPQRITPAPIAREGCGKRNPEGVGFRITGDEDGETQFGEFPWMIAVISETITPEKTLNVYQCGGSLIHPEVVLTSAHCVSNREKIFKIRAGEWDTQTNNEIYPHQDVGVKKVIIHPEFHSGALYNDIALLLLERPLELGENIDTVCLPRREEIFDHSICVASGWGTDSFGKEGKYQVILKKRDLPVVPHKDCENALRATRLGPYFKLHHTFVCAGGEKGKDTCKGDGGSPLVCPIYGAKDRYVQAGIVAWGISCGERGTPGVYANVAALRDWIDDQFLIHNLDTKYYEY